jgi:hypothetical protein
VDLDNREAERGMGRLLKQIPVELKVCAGEGGNGWCPNCWAIRSLGVEGCLIVQHICWMLCSYEGSSP